jgi:non-ribosomal peptide synthetase component F
MDTLSKVSFPIDRSLVGVAGGRTKVSVALRPLACTLAGRPAVEFIAFAALFVFARLLQQETVQARVVVGAGLQVNSPVAARFAGGATLTAALGTLRIGAVSDDAEIDLTILERTSNFAGRGNVLTDICGPEDLQLWLDFDAANLAPLSASDFLEKIGLVLDHLGAKPDTRCSELVLLTPAARGLIPDLAQEILVHDYEFIPSVFFRVAAQYAEYPAIANDTKTYTYAELSLTVSHLANRLVARRLGNRGNRGDLRVQQLRCARQLACRARRRRRGRYA